MEMTTPTPDELDNLVNCIRAALMMDTREWVGGVNGDAASSLRGQAMDAATSLRNYASSELRLAEAEKLPDRWRNIAVLLENEKRKVQWESEEYLSHCAVQSTLERCANGLDAALAHDMPDDPDRDYTPTDEGDK